jgi:hypothetical protein
VITGFTVAGNAKPRKTPLCKQNCTRNAGVVSSHENSAYNQAIEKIRTKLNQEQRRFTKPSQRVKNKQGIRSLSLTIDQLKRLSERPFKIFVK